MIDGIFAVVEKIPLENLLEGYNFSMEIRDEDVQRVFAEWNHCHSAHYQLRPAEFSWHRARQNWLTYQFTYLADVPTIWCVADREGQAAGISTKTLWVSVWGDPHGKVGEFIDEATALAKSQGKTRIYFGSEEFHFLPGVPREDEGFAKVLGQRGFQFSEAADFSGQLQNSALRAYVEHGLTEAERAGWKLLDLSPERYADFSQYLQREFPGRWTREFQFWLLQNNSPAFWNELRNPQGELMGFSRLAVRGSRAVGWLPGALRLPLLPLGPEVHTDSCLGPIGISASERGKGAGKFLLALSLQKLLMRGAVRVSIDWTNAYNYYKPLGLQMVRNYNSAWRDF